MSRLGPLVSPLLVGRDDIVELAGRRISEAASGNGQFLLFSGEAASARPASFGAVRSLADAQGVRVSGAALAPQDRDVPARCNRFRFDGVLHGMGRHDRVWPTCLGQAHATLPR